MKRRFRPAFEQFESRLTPSGTSWPDAQHLTLSFAPDGTNVNGASSSLFQLVDAKAPTTSWQQELLGGLQTWAVNANINVGLVADGGQPLGTTGAVQGDSRFGDVRVAAGPLAEKQLSALSPFQWTGSTWSGESLLSNTADEDTATLVISQDKLFHFVLSGDSSSLEASVAMTVQDGFGNTVLTIEASAGQPPATAMLYLKAGSYQVRFSAMSRTGVLAAPISYRLLGAMLSDSIGPYYTGGDGADPAADEFVYARSTLAYSDFDAPYYY